MATVQQVAPQAGRPGSRSAVFLPEPPGGEARKLARAAGLTSTVADWLLKRGHGDVDALQRFLDPKLSHLTRPDDMADRGAAADRLASAVRRGERICVFGDYDCDGITAAAILTEALQAVGAEVMPLLASRFDGGYGVSDAAVARIRESGARLLVTCDCGSSDHANLARLRDAGLDILVIDHHLVPDEPLPVLAFLNPHRADCGFPYKGLASCGLALSVVAALRSALGTQLDVRRWLDLVAIGTVADVAPLDGDNRPLVRAGLGALRQAGRPGVRALLELARLDTSCPLGAQDIAFRLAPRLNAPGRLGPPDSALQLLLARSASEARAVAAEIEQRQTERRSLQERMCQQAVAQIEQEGYVERAAIVLGQRGWNHGIAGIVAGRLAARYDRPVIVVGFEDEWGRGSVRGPAGSRLHDALTQVSDVLERFGGHQAAAGVQVREERLAELRDRFERACAGTPPSAPAPFDAHGVVRLAADDEPGRVLDDLSRLEPCGEGNPAPALGIEGSVVRARAVRGGHLKLELELRSGGRMGAFAADLGEHAERLEGNVQLVGQLRRDRWRGGRAAELHVEHLLA